MAEDIDVEAMLEAPYKKDEELNGRPKENGDSRKDRYSDSKKRSRSRSKDRKRTKHDSDKKRSRSKDRKRSRDRRRTKSRDRKSRSKDRMSRSKDRRSRSRDRKSKSKDRKSRSRDRRSRSREIVSRSRDRRSKSRDNKRSKSRDRVSRRKSRSRDRKSSPIRDRRKSYSKERRRRSRSKKRSPSPHKAPPFGRKRSPLRARSGSPLEELSPEERDARTVFAMQLSQRIRARDLEEFFSSVGKVRDVRLIMCNKTRRFKGIAYIEFKDPESVALALGLSGQKLLGIPIIVQHTQAEKNRMGNSMPNLMPKGMTGPMRLYVGSLHFNITEDMLRSIFEPFGKIENIQLIMDPETGRSKGYGFVTYHNCDDAKKALEQLNGYELAGRPMKVGNVTERMDLQQQQGPSILDSDELDRSGIDLGATGRLQLMFKLAEGAGMQVPPAAATALSMATGQPIVPRVQAQSTPPIATQCFMLSNMFEPSSESNPNWDVEIRDDVIEECNKHGGVLHAYVDKGSPQGNVYVKCISISTAVASVNSLHGRWFAGRVITAAYVPLVNYHALFPNAMTMSQLLTPSNRK
ncbi:RNA-binding protein 39 isoform X2 [Harmonia axyridis]|uniref:RNA-binding protein 39 isoform X2 n=1 Tax=Harmonia axyridis TaxID=115357 RepID=UPI001E276A00|nr:RNA-binding protein 39 isoform X2 [Harmonia axyridis]